MARFVGPLVVGLLLGIVGGVAVAGFLFGDAAAARAPTDAAAKSARAREQEDDARGAAARAAEAAASGPAAATPAPVEAERRAGDFSETSSAPPTVVADAAEFARHAPPPARKHGAKSIRGRVADADGKPIAGVVIRGRRTEESERMPSRSRAGESAPARETLEKAVQDAVERFYDRETDRCETTSDADGRYLLAELRDGRWWLEAWVAGYRADPVNADRNGIAPDATIDFLAAPIVRVPVTVLLPDGSPAPRAAVQCRRAGEKNFSRTQGWTAEPEMKLVALAPGDWEVRASLGDPEFGPNWPDALVSDVRKVAIAIGVEPPELGFTLHGSPGVRGHIKFPPGDKRPYVQVKVLPLPAGGEPDLKLLAANQETPNTWTQDGSYVFRDLAPGRYVVGVARNWGQRIAASAVVDVRDAMVEQDLEVPPLDPMRCLVVKATGPDGQLLETVNFQLRVERVNGGSIGRGVEAERKPNGNFWVPLDGQDDGVDLVAPWPDGLKLFLIATTETFGDKTVEIAPGTRALQIKFTSPATLIVAVQGYAGSGHEGRLHLALERAGDDSSHREFSTSGSNGGIAADGTQKLGPVEAGAWRLALQLQPASGNQWERQEIASQEVTLAVGENHASIAIPAIYSLVVEVPDATGGYANIKPAHGDDSRSRGAQLDATGKVTFEALAAGDYTLSIFGGGEPGIMQVRVPAAGPVRFQPMPINALEISISKSDGKLAAAGFQDGDLVVAIEGREFANMIELQAVMAGSMAKKEVAFTVQRGRERLEIKFDGRKLMNPGELGGSFTPASR